VSPGATFTLGYTVVNHTNKTATGVKLTPTIPAGFTVVSHSAPKGTFAGNVLNIGSMALGASVVAQYVVKAPTVPGCFTAAGAVGPVPASKRVCEGCEGRHRPSLSRPFCADVQSYAWHSGGCISQEVERAGTIVVGQREQ